MAANYALPGSLEPPGYGEMARIGALQTEVEHRALAQLRREIGLRNMQQETAAAIAQGQDPLVARRGALLNNARFLFADNPQALVQLQHNEEAAQMRDYYQRAMLQQRMLHEQNYAAAVKSADEARDEANRVRAAQVPTPIAIAREAAKAGRTAKKGQRALDVLAPQLTASEREEIQSQIEEAKDVHAQLTAPRTGRAETLKDKIETVADLDRAYTEAIAAGDPVATEAARVRLATAKDLLKLPPEGGEGEPTIKTLADGTKLVWMPGASTVHVVNPKDSWEAFYTKGALELRRASVPPETIEKELRDIWSKAHPGKSASASPKPVVSDATAAATLKFEPGKTYVDAQGNKAVYQADGTWKPVK